MSSKLKTLNAQLTRIKASLDRFSRKIESLDISDSSTYNIQDIKIYHNEWQPIMSSVNDIHAKMHELVDEQIDKDRIDKEIDDLFDQYTCIGAVLNEIVDKSKHVQSQLTSLNESKSHAYDDDEIKLSAINIPVFSGNIDQWDEFKSTLVSLVHNQSRYTSGKKLHILRRSLKGDAFDTIASVPIEESNYQLCWDLLLSAYDNKRKMVSYHLNQFLQIPPLNSESSDKLRTTTALVRKHIKALENIIPSECRWDHLVSILISKKLDPETKKHWLASDIAKNDFQKIDLLLSFILERAHQLDEQRCESNPLNKPKNRKSFVSIQKLNCSVCKGNHNIYKCTKFLNLDVTSRINEIKMKNLCINCLSRVHRVNDCTSPFRCTICKKKHNSLLHLTNQESESPALSASTSSTLTSRIHQPSQVMLTTALINILDDNGCEITARALLDNGSQSSFVTNDLANKLKLPLIKSNMTITGIGNSETKTTCKIKLIVKSSINNYKTSVNCFVLDKISDNIPHVNIELNNFSVPPHLRLADPLFHQSRPVDILLGADIFWKLLRIGSTKIINNQCSLQNTSLGWIVTNYKSNVNSNNNQCYHASLKSQIIKFWEIESVKECNPFTAEEQACQDHFIKTTTRNSNGRFVVNMPFKISPTSLGDSKITATNRFLALERKFVKNQQFKDMFASFIHEYLALGHMTLNPDPRSCKPDYYLPHHGVIRTNSATTKLRVVFDGSALSSTKVSLNALQAKGPTIQNDLLTILTKFRQYQYVVVADIAMMYRQILVDPSQRNLQQILWRDNPNDELQCFNLNTLTYGTLSASYLAIRCLTQLGYDNTSIHPEAANSIINDFYVDDLLTGSNNLLELKNRISKIIKILSSAGLNLRKWVSNDRRVLSDLKNTTHDKHFYIDKDDVETFKTLGVMWNSEFDYFKYNVNNFEPPKTLTKRNILSFISKLFDPLGLLSPCIITFKIIIQQLWQLNLKWDDKIPDQIETHWKNLIDQLPSLNNIVIPRMALINDFRNVEIHGFCDASERAYGACIYLRSTNRNMNTKSTLLQSKSKVAPLKTLTIPCLELSAALLLSRMVQRLLKILSVNITRVILWSDSIIVLSWLKRIPNTLKTFVANRVSEIQNNLNNISQWRHVRTDSNPADLISRGVLPNTIKDNSFWWQGPDWLLKPEPMWPESDCNVQSLPEDKLTILVNLAISKSNILFERFSSLRTLNRVNAYCLRFIHNCKNTQNKLKGGLTVSELEHSMQCLVKMVQRECFKSELISLMAAKPLPSNSSLLCLNPFLDQNDIIRVGGRLTNSMLKYNQKHPIVLPNKHKFTTLIMTYEHLRLYHTGPQHLLFSVREQYWPIKGISLAKSIVYNCITCFKHKPRFSAPKMGALPSERVSLDYPFKCTGVDYAGPILIKNKYGRGCKLTKAYICLFICFATKAIHLELVTDLTTQCFMSALNRFISRRGKPKTIYSDNGTNFVGASRALGMFLSNKNNATIIKDASADNSISWTFIPPYSPHWGGLWESNIKSTKYHLNRVTKTNNFTYIDTYTVLTQIEAILNSRPLFPASNDPNDLTPITPGHLLIGRQITSIAPQEESKIKTGGMQRFLQIQSCIQSFWKRWYNEYLGHCNQISKWKTSKGVPPQVGSLVIIKEPNMPPDTWMLGRVTELSEGNDCMARLATIKTKRGTLKRLVRHLAALPLTINSEIVC